MFIFVQAQAMNISIFS